MRRPDLVRPRDPSRDVRQKRPLTGRPLTPVVTLPSPSGLRIVVQTDRRLPLVAVHSCYLSGAGDEPVGYSGLAHLTEHLAARYGTRHGSSEIPLLGGVANAATTHDRTSFTQLLPSDALAAGLRIHAQRASWTLQSLTDDCVAIERRVLQQERFELIENRLYGRSLELLQALMFPAGHPYARPVAGVLEDLQTIARRDVKRFVAAHYTSDNCVLAIVGNVSPGEAARHIEPTFGAACCTRPSPAPMTCAHAVAVPSTTPSGPRRLIVEDAVPGIKVFLALRTDGFGARAWYGAALLIRSLVLGHMSPLKRRLIHEAGVASDIQALAVTFRHAGLLTLACSAAPGVERVRLEDALHETVRRCLTEPVSERSLESACAKALTDHYAGMQYLDAQANQLAARAGFLGDPDGLSGEAQRWTAWRPVDLLEIGHALCRPERQAVLSIVPRGAR